MDEILNGGGKGIVALKSLEIVHFALQNAPEALHRAVVNASAYPRHTLCHAHNIQFCLKLLAGVLVSAVAVEKRLGTGVCLHSYVEGIKDELVVIAFTDCEGNNVPALEVKDSAQIQLLTIAIFRSHQSATSHRASQQ